MKGPRPTPTVLKLLRGNPGKRAINRAEPEPGALDPRTPKELVDSVARREWKRTIVPAITIGQVTQNDRTMAIAHCQLFADWQSQIALAAAGSHVIVGRTGHPIPNVARGMANTTLTLLARIDSELGLTPAARTRVRVAPSSTKSANPLDRFLKKGGTP